MVVFIQNFAEDHAILLPGRIPGYNRFDLQLLPSNTSKLSIWESYTQSIEPLGVRVAGYKSFRNIWTKYLPQIIITKPMSDLCWTCQQNNSLIVRSTNKSEEEKSTVSFKFQDIYMYMYMHKIINNINHYRYVLTIFQALKLAEQHLLAVSKERSYFRTVVKTSKDEVKEHFTISGCFTPPSPHCCLPPSSLDVTVHYSFDFAQQVHYPSDPHQPGPVYFLTPRKCAIFGVCCKAIPRQVNYLIDEAVDVGKGANTVVSMLHHFFSTHGLGEKHVHLHADNCVGQNKNNTMIQVSLLKSIVKLLMIHTFILALFSSIFYGES